MTPRTRPMPRVPAVQQFHQGRGWPLGSSNRVDGGITGPGWGFGLDVRPRDRERRDGGPGPANAPGRLDTDTASAWSRWRHGRITDGTGTRAAIEGFRIVQREGDGWKRASRRSRSTGRASPTASPAGSLRSWMTAVPTPVGAPSRVWCHVRLARLDGREPRRTGDLQVAVCDEPSERLGGRRVVEGGRGQHRSSPYGRPVRAAVSTAVSPAGPPMLLSAPPPLPGTGSRRGCRPDGRVPPRRVAGFWSSSASSPQANAATSVTVSTVVHQPAEQAVDHRCRCCPVGSGPIGTATVAAIGRPRRGTSPDGGSGSPSARWAERRARRRDRSAPGRRCERGHRVPRPEPVARTQSGRRRR